MKKQFISIVKSYIPEGSTLLLAVSGGPDSKALLELFSEVKEDFGFEIHVAHFDHAYRPESQEEAEGLALYCTERNIPFHRKRLEENIPASNIEDFFRNKRYSFFQEIYHKIGAFALILGHHLDDQIETTLKRWFEGANFLYSQGIKELSTQRGMQLFRPLLSFSKKQLLEYLKEKESSYYSDSSNLDPKFLRGRLRGVLIPYLEESFGKEIKGNILRLQLLHQQMDHYLSLATAPFFQKKKPFLDGYFFDFSKEALSHPLEIYHLLSTISVELGIHARHQELQAITQILGEKKGGKEVYSSSWNWYIEREGIYVLPSTPFTFGVVEGSFQPFFWERDLSKQCVFPRPSDEYQLTLAPLSTPCINGSTLAQHYYQNRVPSFLRKKIPCFMKDGKVYHDLLTGKMLKNKQIC